jgi:hypothetical protein
MLSKHELGSTVGTPIRHSKKRGFSMTTRREAMRLGFIAAVILGLIGTGRAVAGGLPVQLKNGDILVTRNSVWNIVPFSWWNHTAIYDASSGYVIEAQFSPQAGWGAVLRTDPITFFNRYPTLMVLRPNAQYLTSRATQYARSLVGQVYYDYNCVKLVRASYYYATLAYSPDDPGWYLPDNVANDFRLIPIYRK